MINEPDNWGAYGLPGAETIKIRHRISYLIENYCSENRLDFGRDVDFGAGANCFVVEVNVPLTEKQKSEIKQIVLENSPPDHSYHLIECHEQPNK
jgi:hypothetical protein